MNSRIIATDRDICLETELDVKIFLALQRIQEWYEYWEGNVYIALSGGKDSRVMADLVWSLYPEVPGVFSNTGLEYPEVVQLIKQMKKAGYPIVIVRPERTFRDVILNDGYPLVSKSTATKIRRVQNPTEKNAASRHLYLTGYRRDGVYKRNSKIPDKWMKLVDAPFKTTEICCDHLKKDPLIKYSKETGRKPYIGMMKSEGGVRGKLTECNAYDARHPQSRPLLPWTDADVWEYIHTRKLDYPEVYDDRTINGQFVKGEERTGCMFCAFGAHLEKGQNRFQRMKISHPKLWSYCIHKLNMKEPLDFIGVPYKPTDSNEKD